MADSTRGTAAGGRAQRRVAGLGVVTGRALAEGVVAGALLGAVSGLVVSLVWFLGVLLSPVSGDFRPVVGYAVVALVYGAVIGAVAGLVGGGVAALAVAGVAAVDRVGWRTSRWAWVVPGVVVGGAVVVGAVLATDGQPSLLLVLVPVAGLVAGWRARAALRRLPAFSGWVGVTEP